MEGNLDLLIVRPKRNSVLKDIHESHGRLKNKAIKMPGIRYNRYIFAAKNPFPAGQNQLQEKAENNNNNNNNMASPYKYEFVSLWHFVNYYRAVASLIYCESNESFPLLRGIKERRSRDGPLIIYCFELHLERRDYPRVIMSRWIVALACK